MRLNFLCGVQTSESLLPSYSNWSHHGSPCNRSRISEVKQELSSRIPYKCIEGRQHSPVRIATERYRQCDHKATWGARGQEECLSPLRSSSPDRTGAKWKDGDNVGILWFFNLKHRTYFPSEDRSWRDYFQGILTMKNYHVNTIFVFVLRPRLSHIVSDYSRPQSLPNHPSLPCPTVAPTVCHRLLALWPGLFRSWISTFAVLKCFNSYHMQGKLDWLY